MNKYSFIDLFAGAGGLSLGLEESGFTPYYVNELNNDALETYLINRDEEFPHLRDRFHSNSISYISKNKKNMDQLKKDLKNVMNLDPDSGELTLLTGGPPCQGYSGIGHRRSHYVDKDKIPSNYLYKDMAKCIKELNPKIFLFENVRGLLTSKWTDQGKKGEIWQDVVKSFSKLKNYNIDWKLLKAKEYGVPQNRPRIILVGIRNDIEFKSLSKTANGLLPDGGLNPPHLKDVLSDLIDVNYTPGGATKLYPRKATTKFQQEMRKQNGKILDKGAPLTEHVYTKHSENITKKFKFMIENDGVIPEKFQTKKFSQKVLLKKWGDKGPNITATSLPDDYIHYAQPRILTVREWARLQTFPDWYQFSGPRTTGGIRRAGNPKENNHQRDLPRYTQIGNAVPVLLAKTIGDHFKRILDN